MSGITLATGPFRSLRHRNYRLFWFGYMLSQAGSWLQWVAQGWLVLQLSDSSVYLGLVGATRSVPLILLSLWGGTLADRHDKRKVLYVTNIIPALSATLVGVLIHIHRVQVWHVLVMAAVNATSMAFEQPARQSLIPALVDREDLYNAINLNAIALQGATVLGPSLAGLIVPAWGLEACFWLNAISYGSVLIALALMDFPPDAPVGGRRRQGSLWADMAAGLRYVRSHPLILSLVLMAGMNSFFARSYQAFLPVMARYVLGVGVGGLGLLTTAPGIGVIAGSLVIASIGHRVERRGTLLIALGLLFTATLIAYAWTPWFWLSFVLLILCGAFQSGFQQTTNVLLQTQASDEVRGRVMSLYTMTALAFQPLGQGPMGVAVDLLGISAATTAGALIAFLAIAWTALRVPQVLSLR